MLQLLTIFSIVFVSILAFRGSWRIAARWGLLVAIPAACLILALNVLTLWYGIVPKAEAAVKNLGGPNEPHLLKAIAVPVAILLYSALGGVIRRLILALLAGSKLKFLLGLAALYSLMQVFFAIAESTVPITIRLPIRQSTSVGKHPAQTDVSDGPTKTTNEGPPQALAGRRKRNTAGVAGARATGQDQERAARRAADPGAAPVGQDLPTQAAGETLPALCLAFSAPRKPTTSIVNSLADQAPLEYGDKIPGGAGTSVFSSRSSVGLAIDSTGFEHADWVADSLQDFLSIAHKVRAVADVPRGSSFFDGLYPGREIRQVMNSSRSDYLLVGKVRIFFRWHPEIDSDLITCEMVSAVRLFDRHGSVLQSGVFPAAGPGFSRAQAFNRAVENTARQIASKVLAAVP